MRLDPSTATDILIGQLLDYRYGKDPALGIVYNDSELKVVLIKGVTRSVKTLASSDWTALDDGYYKLSLSASEVGTAGELEVCVMCKQSSLSWSRLFDVGEESVGGFTATDRTNLGAIKTKTDGLNFVGDDVSATTTDGFTSTDRTNMGAIKTKTDKLTFDASNNVAASGAGGASAAEVVAAMDSDSVKLARLDTTVSSRSDFNPTTQSVVVSNYNDCQASTTHLATAAQITALNDYSESEFTSLVATALESYDGIKRTEATADKNAILTEIDALNINTDSCKLAADGLDNISADMVDGLPTTFPQKMIYLFARFFNKSRVDGNTAIEIYRDDNTTVNTIQQITTDASGEEISKIEVPA